MFVREDFFIYLGIRTTIGVYGYEEEDIEFQSIVELVRPTLQFTLNQLRMKWHANVVANAWLNEEISEIYKELAAEQLEKLEEKKEKVVSLKKLIIQILDDPITYRTSSGSAVTIYEQGKKEFHIEELQRVMVDKKNELDKLYDVLQDKIEDLRIKKRSKDFLKYLARIFVPLIFVLFVILFIRRFSVFSVRVGINLFPLILLVSTIITFIYWLFISKKE